MAGKPAGHAVFKFPRMGSQRSRVFRARHGPEFHFSGVFGQDRFAVAKGKVIIVLLLWVRRTAPLATKIAAPVCIPTASSAATMMRVRFRIRPEFVGMRIGRPLP